MYKLTVNETTFYFLKNSYNITPGYRVQVYFGPETMGHQPGDDFFGFYVA